MKSIRKIILINSISSIVCFAPNSIFAQKMDLSEDTVVEEINMIDVSNDSILCAILNDATCHSVDENAQYYYTIWMNRYKDGTIVRVIKSTNDVYDRRSNIMGYTFFNGQPILFYEGITNYPIQYANPPQSLFFKLGKFDYNDKDNEVEHYYILEDIYARFSAEDGWIWSDGKPDE